MTTMTVPEINFSPSQLEAVEKTKDWLGEWLDEGITEKPKPIFEFTGYAGTGKTTCIQHVVKEFDDLIIEYAAYTGKAARVISRVNKVQASTIHSLIYKYVPQDRARTLELHEQLYGNDKVEDPVERSKIEEEIKEISQPRFELNEDSDLSQADLLILDECSMIPQDMLEDLLTFKVPIIALGDPGQLPPPAGQAALFQSTPDVKLTEIHRQAEGNKIIAAATQARKGFPIPYLEGEDFSHIRGFPNNNELDKADIVLCGKHATRKKVNMKLREIRGFNTLNPFPQVGEMLICRKNDKKKGLFNGDICLVEGVGSTLAESIELFIRPETYSPDAEALHIYALAATFQEYYDEEALKKTPWFIKKKYQEFDYGYALTVHSSQGSQWDHVLFADDGLYRNWREKTFDRRKLIYTAITRAAVTLRMYSGGF